MTDLIIAEKQFNFLTKMATTLSKSSLVPQAFRGKPADIYLALQMGHELGLGQVQSLQSIHVIQGRPSLSAQTMIALIRNRFPDAFIKIENNGNSVICSMARCQEDKENAYVAKWDMVKAKSMGLTSKDNWIKQPETMLRWRAVSEAARFVFPDAIMNLYTPDENESITLSKEEELDRDYGNPNEGKEIGDPEYKILYRKYRGKMNKDLSIDEIEERIDYLEKKEADKSADQKHLEELQNLRIYMENFAEAIELPKM